MARVAGALALATACVPLAAAEPTPASAIDAFAQFKLDFGRVYGEGEDTARLAAFSANYALIQTENAQGHTYTLGINDFADMSQEDFAATRLGLRSEGQKMWGGLPHLGTHVLGEKPLPESVDWRRSMSAVRDQGSCGSCWAFSAIAAIEGGWAAAAGEVLSLSEQQLVDCSAQNHGCHGGLMDLAFMYYDNRTDGGVPICTKDSYPYTAREGACHAAHCTAGLAPGVLVGYRDVAQESEAALAEVVAQRPVAVAVTASIWWQLYSGGVFTGACEGQPNHGVAAVGYGVDVGPKFQKYWLVRNSWGKGWGEGGYMRLAFGVQTAGGKCSIARMASYPVLTGPRRLTISV